MSQFFISYFLQTNSAALCNPSTTDWYHSHAKDNFSCITPCQGIYADVNYHNEPLTGNVFEPITLDYNDLKKQITENGLKKLITENFQFASTATESDGSVQSTGKLILV